MDASRTVAALPSAARAQRWQRAVSALPPLLTAVAFCNAWIQWGSPYSAGMAKTIQLEFLVIHAGLFLGVFLLLPVTGVLFGSLRWVAVAMLGYLYARGAHALLGWFGVLSIAGIFIATYSGLLLSRLRAAARASRGRASVEIGVRWGIAFFAYGLLASFLGLPEQVNEWGALRSSVALGALYFLLLAAIESTTLYPRIRGAMEPAGADQARR